MLLLFETPAGFALFKVLDEGRLEDVDVRAFPPPHMRRWRCAAAGAARAAPRAPPRRRHAVTPHGAAATRRTPPWRVRGAQGARLGV
jgi:hypothetical protein